MATDLAVLTPEGKIRLSFHPGQYLAWQSPKRFIGVIAGTQGGKTSFGPHWLYREIKLRGPGDYIIVTPTFTLLEKKALPEFLKVFKRWLDLGKYVGGSVRKFTFSEEGSQRTFGYYNREQPTSVYFGYAEDPDSLESLTGKAAWCDEAGQKKFKLGSWEAILRRLSIAQGRALVTTTPYDLGWLKQKFYDRWYRAGHGQAHPGDEDYDIVRFDSTENPNFPQEEFERAKRDLPRWKFNLFYRGIFSRPAGLIYDSFLDAHVPLGHKCARFDIPDVWARFLGLDFGGVNTAGVFYAKALDREEQIGDVLVKPPDLHYLYRTYHAGGRTAQGHVEALMMGEPRKPVAVGGAKSEDQWRNEFKKAGLPVLLPPVSDVEVGIDRVHAMHKRNGIIVFDDLDEYLEEKLTYSREVDDRGEPTDKIEDKSAFHLLDAERYIGSYLAQGRSEAKRGPLVV